MACVDLSEAPVDAFTEALEGAESKRRGVWTLESSHAAEHASNTQKKLPKKVVAFGARPGFS